MLADNDLARTRLEEDLVGFLTTVSPDGQPQTSPVWHIVDGDVLVVYSRPNATRLTNLAANPRVAYNLRGDRQGDMVMTMEGIAEVDRDPVPSSQVPAYVGKYREEMARFDWTPERFDEMFSVALRITITRIRAW